MPQSFAVEMQHGVTGLLVRAERGFRFYAWDQAFAELEARQYRRIEDARLDIDMLTAKLRGRPKQRRSARKHHLR